MNGEVRLSMVTNSVIQHITYTTALEEWVGTGSGGNVASRVLSDALAGVGATNTGGVDLVMDIGDVTDNNRRDDKESN